MMANRESQVKPIILKVVLIGNGGVGKSSLMNRFISNIFHDNYYSTLGVDFLNKEIEYCGKKYCLQIWDTAGQEKFKSLRTPFYRGSDICIMTYSVTDQQSFDCLPQWKNEFVRYANPPDPKSFPFVVIGNKCDLLPTEGQVNTNEAQDWCDNEGVSFIEASAKNAVKVEDAFCMALECWLKNKQELREFLDGPTVTLSITQEKGNCCY